MGIPNGNIETKKYVVIDFIDNQGDHLEELQISVIVRFCIDAIFYWFLKKISILVVIYLSNSNFFHGLLFVLLLL